ncbi:hypothetical protein DIPPA_26893, partial [Diplonema papillatum]
MNTLRRRDLGCGQRAEDVILELQLEYVVPGHAFGSDCVCVLESRFEPLREWLYVAESLEGWRGRRQFVSLGELLLWELRIEFVCARDGFSRKEFRMRLQLESEDALDRAVAELWLDRRKMGSAPPSEERRPRRRKRIPPAIRRRRKRDQCEAGAPPQQPNPSGAPLLPPRTINNNPTTPTGLSQAEKEAPLHVAAVPAMDTAALRHRMRPDVRARFDSVWKATFFPVRDVQGENASEGQQRRSHLMHSHASELVRLGIASPSDTPGTFRNVPFTVVEDKAGRLRQRFILWTQEANDLLSRQGYVAQ